MKTTAKTYRVHIYNVMDWDLRCGFGEGKSLAEAQEEALYHARKRDKNAKLSENGREVLINTR